MSTIQLQPFSKATAVDVLAAIPPPTPRAKTPIELHLRKIHLACGAIALRADISLVAGGRTFTIGIYPGFEGGGRAADRCQAPRLRDSASTPKTSSPTGTREDAWPPVAALEWRIDGARMDSAHKPVSHAAQRLDSALDRVEPLLRQLVNQRQVHLEQGRPGAIADQPLIARIKTILSDF